MKQTLTQATEYAAWRTGYARPESRLRSFCAAKPATNGTKPNIHVSIHTNVHPRRGAPPQ
ncbi:MAG TPA: hypothetical protein VL068_08655 [Microthrixaceae bacterium]|nr:hypothetical protein [Microthrixaceae bacterium]